MAITEEMHIDCSPATAFDLMADVRNVTRWNSTVSNAELTSDKPIGLGSQFVTVNKIQEQNVTITAFDRPRRLDFTVTGPRMDIPTMFMFTETDGGTTLIGTFDIRPRGVMSPLFPLLKPMVRRELSRQHERFKQLCESEAQSDDS